MTEVVIGPIIGCSGQVQTTQAHTYETSTIPYHTINLVQKQVAMKEAKWEPLWWSLVSKSKQKGVGAVRCATGRDREKRVEQGQCSRYTMIYKKYDMNMIFSYLL